MAATADLPDMGPGFDHPICRCARTGARLFIGDAHACQGRRAGVQDSRRRYPSTTTIRVDVIKRLDFGMAASWSGKISS